MRKFLLVACIFHLAAGSLLAADISFNLVNNTPFTPVRNGGLAWGDYDNDGFLDVLATGDPGNLNGAAISKLYHNNGNGTFTPTTNSFAGYRSSYLTWADFDNDGYLDLIVTGATLQGDLTRIYQNQGGTNFIEIIRLPAVLDGQIDCADFNNDGRLDFAITGAGIGGTYSKVYRNINGTSFDQFDSGIPQLYYGSISSADFDRDGYLDLLLTGMNNSSPMTLQGAHLLRNDGLGHFQAIQFYQFVSEPGRWSDFNNDGWPDLVLQRWSSQQSFLVLNDNSVSWPVLKTLPIGNSITGDFNNDGSNDVIIANHAFQNSGLAAWPETVLPATNMVYAACADFDNDGKLDFIGSDGGGPTYATYLYRNTGGASNLPPGAPGELKSFSSSTNVILSWTDSIDDHQAGGLTYNLRLGTSPGGSDIISPMSAPDGFRRVVRPGNAGYLTSYNLKGLQPGRTYYWSVQAVDNSFSGSAFAPEQSFIATSLPSISNLTNRTVLEDANPLSIPITVGDVETPANLLTVTATSSNPQLVAQSNLVLAGSAENRTLTITAQPDQNGLSEITVTVTDANGGVTARKFELNVLPVNDPPRFAFGIHLAQDIDEDAGLQIVPGFATSISPGPADESGQQVKFAFDIFSYDPSLFSIQPTLSSDGTLTYMGATNAHGTALMAVILRDDGGTSNGGTDSTWRPLVFQITMFPVNDAPIAKDLSLSVNEDTFTALTLSASDVDGDLLNYSFTQPSHGILTGTPPNLIYRPNTNYFGTDSFTYSVSDGQLNSATATVSITVGSINDAPAAKIALWPPGFSLDATNRYIIARNGIQATLLFDGSQSRDSENSPLQYLWKDGNRTFATGVVATNAFNVGEHTFSLIVNDGMDTGTDKVTVRIVKLSDAFMILFSWLQEQLKKPGTNKQELLDILQSAIASLNQGNLVRSKYQLTEFQNKAASQPQLMDQTTTSRMMIAAREIANAIQETPRLQPNSYMMLQPAGNKRLMRFTGSSGQAYVIEASTNLLHWQTIGISLEQKAGSFEFEDTHASQFPKRFYRIKNP